MKGRRREKESKMAEKEAKSKTANGGSAGGNGPESSEFRSGSDGSECAKKIPRTSWFVQGDPSDQLKPPVGFWMFCYPARDESVWLQ